MNRLYIQDSGETYRNTTYLAYTKPTHQLGELVTAGIEKLLEITKVPSPASRLQAAAAKEVMYNAEQGNYSNPVYLEGHSRGTMTLSNALRLLAADHLLSDDLKILAFNPAAEGNRLTEATLRVTGEKPYIWAPPKDFVANKIGGYAGNATFHDLWKIFQTNYSVHSSGGTAAQFSSHTLNLTAAGNLDAHSAQSTQEQTSSQRHRSASLGTKIGVTGGGPSVSADVASGRGSAGRDSAEGQCYLRGAEVGNQTLHGCRLS
ncbi:hemagglutinin repeat-containing protein [Xylella fastidiosa]|uniref:hemagglutinin repeat-containing protein n=1 Tax=Xylella fastidiosa TaxID=2371 RepID=UPI000401FDE8|nr:hemagglutinin repeat-containing protein [Xylella fastidiosa]